MYLLLTQYAITWTSADFSIEILQPSFTEVRLKIIIQSQSQRVLLQQNHKHTWNNTKTETHLGLFASYNLGLSYIAMTSLWWQQG